MSIIIPLWNARRWWGQLTETLARQGVWAPHSDVEVLCVDDGSTDGTPDMVREFAREHPNVRLFEQRNAGQAAARNLGLDNARGEWVYMMDQDDVLAPDTLLPMLEVGIREDVDLVRFKFDMPPSDEARRLMELEMPGGEVEVVTGKDVLGRTRGLIKGEAGVWTTIARRSFLDDINIRFDPRTRYFEDEPFSWKMLLNARRVALVDRVGYHWLQRPDSDFHTATTEHIVKRRLTLCHVAEDLARLRTSSPSPIDRMLCIRADWYEFAFWSLVFSHRAITRGEAREILRRHEASGVWPANGPFPSECPDLYPQTPAVRLRWKILNSKKLINLLFLLLLK